MMCFQLSIHSLRYSTNSKWHAVVFVHALTIIYILHRAEANKKKEKKEGKRKKRDRRVPELVMTLFYKYPLMGKKMSFKDKVACCCCFFSSLVLRHVTCE